MTTQDEVADGDEESQDWGAAVSSWSSWDSAGAEPEEDDGAAAGEEPGPAPSPAPASTPRRARTAAPKQPPRAASQPVPTAPAGTAVPLAPPSDADDWNHAARAFHRNSLTGARHTAERWVGGVAGLLVLFGCVVIGAGPGELGRVPSGGARWLVLVLTVLAGIAAAASLVIGTSASHAPLAPGTPWDGEAYRSHVARETHEVARKLLLCRVSGFAAAGLVFLAAAVLIGAGAAHPAASGTAPSVLVVRRSGQLVCGPLATDGAAVTVGGRRIADVVSVTVVTSC